MERIPSELLQQFIRDNMTYEEYKPWQMVEIYKGVMDRELFLGKYPVMTDESFRRRISEWAKVDGGWLIRKGTYNERIFYKRPIHRCTLSRAELLKRVLKKMGELRPWRK